MVINNKKYDYRKKKKKIKRVQGFLYIIIFNNSLSSVFVYKFYALHQLISLGQLAFYYFYIIL